MALDRLSPPHRHPDRRHAELTAQLAEVGLELWQSPEGFYAIRLKPAVAPAPPRRSRRRRGPR